jgi:hypothetical protein
LPHCHLSSCSGNSAGASTIASPEAPYTDQHLFDGMATWSPENLLRMDEQFVVAVEIAFRRGLEDPDIAARTYDLRRRLP